MNRPLLFVIAACLCACSTPPPDPPAVGVVHAPLNFCTARDGDPGYYFTTHLGPISGGGDMEFQAFKECSPFSHRTDMIAYVLGSFPHTYACWDETPPQWCTPTMGCDLRSYLGNVAVQGWWATFGLHVYNQTKQQDEYWFRSIDGDTLAEDPWFGGVGYKGYWDFLGGVDEPREPWC